MRLLLLIPLALLAGGCGDEPGPTAPPPAFPADKVALPPVPGEASLEFWAAMDAFMAGGRDFLPHDFAHDTNGRGRTFLDYLPADHPWHEGTARFTCTIGSSRPTTYTLTEDFDPDDPYGNSLRLTIEVPGPSTREGPQVPSDWYTPYGTWGSLNARFRQNVQRSLKIVRAMHRFRAGTTEFWGYPGSAADVFRCYSDDKGRTLGDLYPGRLPFANALTGLRTEPAWGEQAAYPGSVGVIALIDRWGLADGFIVTARGILANASFMVSYREAIVDPPWDDPRRDSGHEARRR